MTFEETADSAAETDCGDGLETLLEAQNNLEETLNGLVTSINAYLEVVDTRMKLLEQNLDELILASVEEIPRSVN
ncbi:MAG TPA: hypothetical protein VMB03_10040 [Bryobacteraceae bacterium]|nr:hypothetical protein [Bryobacteraceae bacterium]